MNNFGTGFLGRINNGEEMILFCERKSGKKGGLYSFPHTIDDRHVESTHSKRVAGKRNGRDTWMVSPFIEEHFMGYSMDKYPFSRLGYLNLPAHVFGKELFLPYL